MSRQLVEAFSEMREDEALKLVQEMLDRGEDPARVLELCQEAMEIVGKRYESGEYFLPELMMSGAMLEKVAELVKPGLAASSAPVERLGRVLVGTVEGDIHDIGKNILTFLLDVNGFDVLDLGVDVPADRFVKAIEEFRPQVVALSGFLTIAFDAMKNTIAAITEAGLREDLKIAIGGGQINEMVREYTGADAYGSDAMAGVALVKRWVGVR